MYFFKFESFQSQRNIYHLLNVFNLETNFEFGTTNKPGLSLTGQELGLAAGGKMNQKIIIGFIRSFVLGREFQMLSVCSYCQLSNVETNNW